MVTIAQFSWPAQACLARCRLAACGIEAWVPDEYTSSLLWHYSNLLGGIRLQVSPDDVEDALAVLNEDRPPAGEPIATDRELATDRALRSAVFGVVQPLFYLWSLWLLVPVVFRHSSTSDPGRRNILLTVLLIAVPALATLLFQMGRRL